MAATTSETLPNATFGSPGSRQVELKPTRSTTAASRISLRALIQRDLVVLWKHKIEFVIRTLVQPFLLCFVFLYVFPKIGQGIGGGSVPWRRVGVRHGPRARSRRSLHHVPGHPGRRDADGPGVRLHP